MTPDIFISWSWAILISTFLLSCALGIVALCLITLFLSIDLAYREIFRK